MAEAFRSGLETVAEVQTESALSLGMNRLQVMRYVVLPQAFSISVPAFMANVIFSWDDENYYLVGYDSEAELIKHYRVDKMLHIRMSTEAREGKEHFKQLDMADYAKKSFGMFGGKEKTVKLLVDNRLAGVIIDRFGKDIMLIPADENHFTVNVDVHVSKQFLGWVFSLGEQVKILSPEDVVEQMRGEVKRLVEQYGE